MKYIIVLVIFVIIFAACTNKGKNKTQEELQTGGIYISQNEDGSFGVSKILVLDGPTVHIRMYTDKFEIKPADINSEDLNFFIGHVPMAKNGFLLDKPEFLKVEAVTEEELEGYKYYLEAMKN